MTEVVFCLTMQTAEAMRGILFDDDTENVETIEKEDEENQMLGMAKTMVVVAVRSKDKPLTFWSVQKLQVVKSSLRQNKMTLF
jgi:hypothetical protein